MAKLVHKQTIDWKGISHDLELYESNEIKDLKPITQAQAIPFVDDDHIVIYKHVDGYYGLPGGTVELGENFQETLEREVYEECACKVIESGLLGYVKDTQTDTKEIKYQLRYWAKIELLDEPIKDPVGKSLGREVVTLEEAAKKLEWGERGEKLLKLAAIKYKINQLGLILLEAIQSRVFKCKDKNEKLVIFKTIRNPTEIEIYKNVLNTLRNKYQKKFKRLILPELLDTDNKSWMIIPFYEGIEYRSRWNEFEIDQFGGIALGKDLAKEMAEVVSDLKKISTSDVQSIPSFKKIKNNIFNFGQWLEIFNQRASKLIENHIISKQQFESAKKILDSGFKKQRLVFSSGDFYPRNIIKDGGKLVIIDWENWDHDFRVNYIDNIENLIAFSLVHMWNNFLWQFEFLKNVQRHTYLDDIDFQKALLIRSFDQMYFWKTCNRTEEMEPGLKILMKFQAQIFSNALNLDWVKTLLKATRPKLFFWLRLT